MKLILYVLQTESIHSWYSQVQMIRLWKFGTEELLSKKQGPSLGTQKVSLMLLVKEMALCWPLIVRISCLKSGI